MQKIFDEKKKREIYMQYESKVKKLTIEQISYLLEETTKSFSNYKSSKMLYTLFEWHLKNLQKELDKKQNFS